MKEIKRTSVPVPGLKSKSQANSTRSPSKAPVSSEFVDSSDDSSNETAATQSKVTEKHVEAKATTNIAVHRPKANGVTKATSKITSNQNGPPKVAPKPIVPPKTVSKERKSRPSNSAGSDHKIMQSQDSARRQKDSEESSDHTSESGSSDDSSDDSGSEPAPKATQALAREYATKNYLVQTGWLISLKAT